jgi:hypothetical protein
VIGADFATAMRRLEDPRVTLGLLVDPDHLPQADFDRAILARQWRAVARMAYDNRFMLVAAGRPFSESATGFYVLVKHRDSPLLATAVVAANNRMAAAGSTETVWLLHADDDLRDRVTAILAAQMPVLGTA